MTQRLKTLILTAPLLTPLFLTTLVLTTLASSAATAQSADVTSASDLPQPIAAARCQYTPEEGTCPEVREAPVARDSTGSTTVAQVPRPMPFPPRRVGRPMSYTRYAYPGPGMGEHSGRHALIGAIIGGALGAAIGSKGNASSGATAAFTLIGAGLGAAFGLSIPPMPTRYPYRRSWRDRDEDASRSGPANPAATRASAAPAEAASPSTGDRPSGIVFNSSGTP